MSSFYIPEQVLNRELGRAIHQDLKEYIEVECAIGL